jgi:hypothetical protein
VLDGTPMPVVAPIGRDSRTLDGVARDAYGNAVGGLRAPWITVAAAQYLARCSCSPTVGETIPFTDEELASIHGGTEAFAAARGRAIDDLVSARQLLPGDAAVLRAATGSCIATP